MRAYIDIGLKGNPFQLKMVNDYNDFIKFPFLITESQKIILTTLKSSFLLPYDMPVYYLILGERGSGKTSTLLWLYDIVQKEGNEKIVGKYERSVAGMGSIIGLANKLLPDRKVLYTEYQQAESSLKKYLEGKRYYWFIDVPDMVSKRDLEVFLRGLEILLSFKNISVYIAMNKSHYNKCFEISEILGKFTPITIKPFNLEETAELIESRMKTFAISETPKLFTQTSIETVWKISKGIPRNIISACDLILERFLNYNFDIIDENFIKEVLSEDLAYKILEERIESESERVWLYKLYQLIKVSFNGFVENQKRLAEEASKNFNWSYSTVLKRLRKLEKLGLITIDKSEKDGWTKIIRVVV